MINDPIDDIIDRGIDSISFATPADAGNYPDKSGYCKHHANKYYQPFQDIDPGVKAYQCDSCRQYEQVGPKTVFSAHDFTLL